MEKSTTISLTLLGLIADCAADLRKLRISHLFVSGDSFKGHNLHDQRYVDVDISSLYKSENEEKLELSIEASLQNIARIRSAGKSCDPNSKVIGVTEHRDSYLLSDAHRQTEIPKVAMPRLRGAIEEFLKTGQVIGADITLAGPNEISLKGNEHSVFLGIYADQLSSVIIPGQPEHFFHPDAARQMKRKERALYKSKGFLKFGVPDFQLSLHVIAGEIWLLTKGMFADGVTYNVIEKLTNSTQ